MFFALIFLTLAALGAYFFPEWSWAAILGASFGCVVALRLALYFTERSKTASAKDSQP
ncbi:MAG: hypothetical protein H6R13_789 [Proteobacteria bacterium]|nr:hypothetical protein [Pseudomonadota bacterium]